MATHPPLTSLDSLYCEERWDESSELREITRNTPPLLLPTVFSLAQDMMVWEEDDELLSLFSRETETHLTSDPSLSLPRTAAVRWILRVNAHYGFSALTPILAVNYLDRFLSGLTYQEDKPWMIQLSSVACLSLAAKVEEIHVPLLLDLQVEDAEYVFDSKTLQKMELLVLTTLNWRMNLVTPLSFLDHIIKRLGLDHNHHLRTRCERLILSFLPDSRFVRYLPSVVAIASMLHVIHEVEASDAVDYQNQLFSVLQTSKEKVNSCYEVMREVSKSSRSECHHPSSPSGVIDAAAALCCTESFSDWWDTASPPPTPPFKKMRFQC
ncbi:unnamed protein product [Cuscuta epithymum]|uniref:Cyclin D3 n=1 Tax=Cuscuta epithymum TaxID=186058 RepID=A0AAV0G9H0_9ASTE|nr:unnamed protein product [Cuscuta epithymum]